MQTIALQQVRLVPAWRPASAAWRPAVLGQQAPPSIPQQPPAVVVIPPPETKPPPPFIDSALVAAIMDFVGVWVTARLAYGATYPGVKDVKPSRWAYVFLALAAGLTVKGIADLSRVRER